MSSSEDNLQKLLVTAEAKFGKLKQENNVLQQEIEALKLDNQSLSQSFFDLIDAQKQESEQMVQLTEQLWALEKALALSKEKALEQMGLMKLKMESVNEYVKDTLEAASKNAPVPHV